MPCKSNYCRGEPIYPVTVQPLPSPNSLLDALQLQVLPSHQWEATGLSASPQLSRSTEWVELHQSHPLIRLSPLSEPIVCSNALRGRGHQPWGGVNSLMKSLMTTLSANFIFVNATCKGSEDGIMLTIIIWTEVTNTIQCL